MGCGQPCDGLYCNLYTCQQCGVVLTNVICLNCTYGDGKPITCCECEGPLRGGFCLFSNLKAENSFTYDPNSFNDTLNNFNHIPQPQYETYLSELCGNNSNYGYNCPPQFPLLYEQEPSYNQNYNDNYYPHNSPSFLCCENCEGPHATFQCQPISQNINFFGFDQIQSPQYPDIYHLPQEISEEILKAKENLMKSKQTFLKKFNHISFREMPKVLSQAWEKFFKIQHAQPEDTHELLRKLIEDLQIIKNYSNAIAPVLPTEEPDNSLSMGNEHLSTIPEKESDEVTKSSVENLVPIPSEFEDFFDNESECDVPVCDDFMTFSNTLFDCNDNFTSVDDDSLSNEDEFSGKLAHTDPIPPRIEEADFDLEEEIRLVENLLYDNSSPRPPKELNAEIADTIVEYLSPSRILVEDSESQIEVIDLFLDKDDLMPSGIENGDYDSEGDIHFLEELPSNDPFSLPKMSHQTLIIMMILVEDIYVLMPKVLPTQPNLCLNIDTLLSFSSENEDKVFKLGILSSLLVSFQDKAISDFSENPMMMYEGDIPHLDVPHLHFYPP
uniref:Pre-mRNA splicing Prp18-interacting factor n=1 Tax=Tanacetum cinerariifolium TaxID=118510 RepID=A0A6L2NLQ5_TANCI|nr:hypothetical protein [Tanacetum cinerariifolium]